MAWRIMMVQETGEEVCYTSGIDTVETAMDELDFAYENHPECRFYAEPEYVSGTDETVEDDESFEDVPF